MVKSVDDIHKWADGLPSHIRERIESGLMEGTITFHSSLLIKRGLSDGIFMSIGDESISLIYNIEPRMGGKVISFDIANVEATNDIMGLYMTNKKFDSEAYMGSCISIDEKTFFIIFDYIQRISERKDALRDNIRKFIKGKVIDNSYKIGVTNGVITYLNSDKLLRFPFISRDDKDSYTIYKFVKLVPDSDGEKGAYFDTVNVQPNSVRIQNGIKLDNITVDNIFLIDNEVDDLNFSDLYYDVKYGFKKVMGDLLGDGND